VQLQKERIEIEEDHTQRVFMEHPFQPIHRRIVVPQPGINNRDQVGINISLRRWMFETIEITAAYKGDTESSGSTATVLIQVVNP
jgi:hypothetical protein